MALKLLKPSYIKIPLLKIPLRASFPSPTDDYFQKRLDPRDLLDINQNTSFSMEVQGHGWSEYGILDKDILVVDRSLPLTNNRLVVVSYQEEFALRRIGKVDGVLCFFTAKEDGEVYHVEPESPVTIWGVVSRVIRVF
ncbi:LexA family protein [Leptospira stimsonii]|uniref:Peptidase S24 n=1 Tax=Leptospira stimsonii TaxID=2202203 RepID=A0A396YTR0_9LEPT|nr:S24 family peptidase [Leptospira stimsonii]RHX84754.1 peptidase S24 [Leptospira stimsonii]